MDKFVFVLIGKRAHLFPSVPQLRSRLWPCKLTDNRPGYKETKGN